MNLKYIKGAVTLSEKLQTQTSHTNNVSLVICVGDICRKLHEHVGT